MYKAFKELRAADGDPGDDRRAGARHGRDRRPAKTSEGRGRCRSAARCCTAPTTELPDKERGPREGDLGGDGRGQVPRPVQGLRGGRPQARGRLAQPPADHRDARRQALRRLRGLRPRRPRVGLRLHAARCPGAATSSGASRSAARSAARRRGSRSRAFRGRPWNLCLNDDCPTMVEMREKRAEREAREGGQGGGRRRRTTDGAKADRRRTADPAAATGDAGASARRRTARRARPHRASAELTAGGRVRHPRGDRRLRQDDPGRLLATALGPDTLLLASPGGTGRASGSASCSRTPRRARPAWPSCCSSAPPAPSWSPSVIRPALDAGRDVVCDRFIDSTVAYQGAARGLGAERGRALNDVATGRLHPGPHDAAADRSRAAAAERVARRGRRPLRARGPRVPGAVAAAYDEIARSEPGRSVVVDAEGSVEEVHARVMEAVGQRATMSAMTIPAALSRGDRGPAGGAGGARRRRSRRPAPRLPLRRPARDREGATRRAPSPPSSSPTARPIPTTPAGARSPIPRRIPTSSGCARPGPSTWSRTSASA